MIGLRSIQGKSRRRINHRGSLSKVELDRICSSCNGEGGKRIDDLAVDWIQCSRCEGTGRIPTDIGKMILEFLDRHAS